PHHDVPDAEGGGGEHAQHDRQHAVVLGQHQALPRSPAQVQHGGHDQEPEVPGGPHRRGDDPAAVRTGAIAVHGGRVPEAAAVFAPGHSGPPAAGPGDRYTADEGVPHQFGGHGGGRQQSLEVDARR